MNSFPLPQDGIPQDPLLLIGSPLVLLTIVQEIGVHLGTTGRGVHLIEGEEIVVLIEVVAPLTEGVVPHPTERNARAVQNGTEEGVTNTRLIEEIGNQEYIPHLSQSTLQVGHMITHNSHMITHNRHMITHNRHMIVIIL